ncbi:MAG TPA: NTP transferase domain-containing protein, partial [Acidobacteriota bacterium]
MESFVSAIVLAAGMSKRMGALKQLIKVGDRTLLEKTLSSVGQSRAGETILVLGHRSEEIRQAIQIDPATKIVLNDQYENG